MECGWGEGEGKKKVFFQQVARKGREEEEREDFVCHARRKTFMKRGHFVRKYMGQIMSLYLGKGLFLVLPCLLRMGMGHFLSYCPERGSLGHGFACLLKFQSFICPA